MKILCLTFVYMFLFSGNSQATVLTICESSSQTLSCPSGQVMQIYEAWYGRQNFVDCVVVSANTLCIKDITSSVRSLCEDKSSCVIQAENNVFGDPCPGTKKYVSVDYKCVTYANLKTVIDTAIQQGLKEINLTPGGIYTLKTLEIYYVKSSLKINGNGATLIFNPTNTDFRYDLLLALSTNITIQDLFIDHYPLTFTQGKVTFVDPQGFYFEALIDANYPLHSFRLSNGAAHLFDPVTRIFKEEGAIYQSGQVELVAGKSLRVRARAGEGPQATIANVQVNDLVVIMGPRNKNVILQEQCRNTLLKNITIYTSTSQGLVESKGGANVYDQVKILRGPSPTPTSQPRLMTLGADSFYLGSSTPGSIVKNCIAEFNGDDFVNTRIAFPKVTRVQGNDAYLDLTWFTLEVGDTMNVYDGTTMAIKDVVTVTAIGYLDASGNFQRDRITLSSTAKVKAGDALISYQRAQFFQIINSVFRYTATRGLVISGRNILIQNNQVIGTSMGGIWIGAEFAGYSEGPFPDTITIKDNVLTNICYTRKGRASIFFGAISVMTDTNPTTLAKWNSTYVNRNILIVNNHIEKTAQTGIYISQTLNANVCFNELIDTNRRPTLNGFDVGWGVDTTYSLPIKDSRQVNLYRNRLSSSKPIKVTGSNQVNLNSLYDPCGSKTVSNNNLNIKINMKSHTSSVFGLTSLPGDQVASASQDTIVKIWNRVTGQLVANLVGHTSRVWTVVYMPNGVLATGAGDKTVKLWSIATGKVTQSFVSHTDEVTSLVVLSDGTLVSTSLDATVKIWSSVAVLQTITTPSLIRCALLLSNDFLVTGHGDGKLRVINLSSKLVTNTLTGHTATVNSLTILQNGNLVSGGSDNKILVWDTNTFVLLKSLGPYSSAIRSLAGMPNRDLAAGFDSSQVVIINPVDWTTRQTVLTLGGPVTAMTILPNGDLMVGTCDGNVGIYSRI